MKRFSGQLYVQIILPPAAQFSQSTKNTNLWQRQLLRQIKYFNKIIDKKR
jgi:hypothetical protein